MAKPSEQPETSGGGTAVEVVRLDIAAARKALAARTTQATAEWRQFKAAAWSRALKKAKSD